MTVDRLTSRIPALAAAIRAAPRQSQRRAATAASEIAVATADLDDPVVLAALSDLLHGGGSDRQRAELAEVVARLDELAWRVQEDADVGISQPDAYVQAFNRARAAQAVLFAFESDAEVAALEASYEASVVIDENSLASAVHAAIGEQ